VMNQRLHLFAQRHDQHVVDLRQQSLLRPSE
jgi:hypothetical protein